MTSTIAAMAAGLTAGLFIASLSAAAAEPSSLEGRGRAVLTRLCSSCHAVGEAGRSPHPNAPPFRIIARRYDIDELTEKLREGLLSTHKDMPDFRFTRQDARAARAYLHSIQQ